MKREDVIEAIDTLRKYNSETNRIEAKTASGGFPKKCYDTFSSFSNKYGGIIIFGLNEEDNFKTEGVYDVSDLQKQIAALCCDSMEPAIRCDILPMEFEDKNIVAVKVDEIAQNKKPCYYKPKGLKNGSYIREGDRDELMSDYEIYALQSYNDHIIEDLRPNKRAKIDDLDKEQLIEYIDKIKLERPNFAKKSFEECLQLCGIVDTVDNSLVPTLAGTMIFGSYPQSFYPQLFIACSVIPGLQIGDVGEFGERFLDNKRVEGTIEEMLSETMKFLRRNMKTRVIINSDGKRIDKPEYPMEALREAVANALIHRDYSPQMENVYISVFMYNDRIEILNPGGLYGINKMDKITSSTIMETRNPTIIRILEEKSSMIENRHTGIPTMIREMEDYNLPKPEFYDERGSFRVIFRNDFSDNKYNNENEKYLELNKKENIALDELKNEVLDYCITPRTAKEIKEYLNIKSRQYISSNIIKPLISEGKLSYTNMNNIKDKNQKYITINK